MLLLVSSVGLFISGFLSTRIAQYPGAFIGLVYGLIGVQIYRECVADADDKQASFLVPFKLTSNQIVNKV